MTTGPVRVEVYDLQGKLLFSGVAQTATISPNNSECALTLASDARATKVVPPPLGNSFTVDDDPREPIPGSRDKGWF